MLKKFQAITKPTFGFINKSLKGSKPFSEANANPNAIEIFINGKSHMVHFPETFIRLG